MRLYVRPPGTKHGGRPNETRLTVRVDVGYDHITRWDSSLTHTRKWAEAKGNIINPYIESAAVQTQIITFYEFI